MNDDQRHPFSLQRGCVLVIDVVESVRLIERDEHATIGRWLALVEHVREEAARDGGSGRIIKSLGDGILLQFDDIASALRTAFATLRYSDRQNAGLPEDRKVHLRMGMESTTVLIGPDDIYGHGVNLAARLATLARPGEIIVSPAVRDELTPDLDADIEDMGECFLKHIAEPVRACRVAPPGHRPVRLTPESLAVMLPTVAVVPFESTGNAVLGEIFAEELIRALSQSDRMNVISRLSTRAFRNSAIAAPAIGHHLRANYVLTGRCIAQDGKVVVTLELSEVRTQATIWTERMTSDVRAILMGDQEPIAAIVGELGKAILKRELDRARTLPLPTVESYGLLLGAIASMYRLSRTEFERAGEMLTHLIDREPRQPLPLAWMGNWHVLRVQQGWTDDPARERQHALGRTQRALDLDSENYQALTFDGFVRTNLALDLEAAEDRYDRATQVNPSGSLALLLKGTMHAFRGEGGAAVDLSLRAKSLSPLDPQRFFYDCLISGALVTDGRYEEAETAAKSSLKLNSTHTSTLRCLAIAQWQLGKHEEARQTVAKLTVLEPNLTVTSWRRNNPSARFKHGMLIADVLRKAGLPEK